MKVRKLPLMILFFVFILLASNSFGKVMINEIMPNPYEEPDLEWVELYSNESVNLTEWVIGTSSKNYTFSSNFTGFLVLACNKTRLKGKFENISEPIIDLNCSGYWLKNENGDIFLYDENGSLVDSYFWDDAKENKSIGRFPDGLNWGEELIPTPGKPNMILQENLVIEVSSTNFVSGILAKDLFKLKIENKKEIEGTCERKNKVEVVYNITFPNGSVIKTDKFEVEVGCLKYSGTGEWIPGNPGKYIICGKIVNSSVNETNFSDNFVCENVTVLESPIKVLSIPEKAKFGDFRFVELEINSTSFNFSEIRILVYGKSSRIVANLDSSKITRFSDCKGDLSVDVALNDSNKILVLVPFFLYPNCDNYYKDGNYEVAVRICKSNRNDFEKFMEFAFPLKVSGRNDNICPKVESKTVYRYIEKPKITEKEFQIIYSPDKVKVGEEFYLRVKIENPANVSKNFTLYSYVFNGRKLISEGWNGEEWKKTWNANKVNVFLLSRESKIVELRNRIKKGIQPGNYTLRVRIVGFKDLDRNLRVEEGVLAVNASLKCFQRNGSILLQITNFGRSYNFTLLILRETLKTRKLYLDSNQTLNLSFNKFPRLFVLVGDDKVLGKCRVKNLENKTSEKQHEAKIVGRVAEVSENLVARFACSLLKEIRDLVNRIFTSNVL